MNASDIRSRSTGVPARHPIAATVIVAVLVAAAWWALFSNDAGRTAFGQAPGGPSYLWRPIAVGAGGFITGYSTDIRGDTRVVRTDVYGAYIWQNDQQQWAQLVTSSAMPAEDRVQNGMNEGVFEITVAPSDPNRLYMMVKGRVYRSDDRGRSWRRATPGWPFPFWFDPNSEFRHYGPFMAVSPIDSNLVFIGAPANGLWRSGDGGANWTKITSVRDPADLRSQEYLQTPGVVIWFEKGPSGQYTGRIWAMSPGSPVTVSSDSGYTFTPLVSSNAQQPSNLKQGAFAPDGTFFGVDQEGASVWRYRNGQWLRIGAKQAGLAPWYRLAAVAANPRTGAIFVFDEGGVGFRSTDNGNSWRFLDHRSRAGSGDPPWLRVSNQTYFATGSVVFDPIVPDRLWITAGTGVYYADVTSSTTQVMWTSMSRGIEELVANDVIQAPGQPALLAAADFGIHVKDDLNAFSTTYGPRERVLAAAQQLDWTPAAPGFVVTNSSDTNIFCCSEDGNAVMAGYSVDSGRSWTKFATLPTPPGTSDSDPWRMSFGTIAVASDNPDNIVWAPSRNRSPFYTTDRGRTWSRVVLPGERLPFTGSHDNYWIQRKTLAADRARPGVFYLVHSGDAGNTALTGLWRTTNGGAQWQKVYSGEIAPNSRYAAKLRAVPGQGGHLFFTSGVTEGDTRLRRSQNGGSSWQVLSDITNVDDVAFGKAAAGASYPTIFLSGRVRGAYGIWRSTDNAKTWLRVGGFPVGSLDQVTVMDADKDVFGRVFIGYRGSGWLYGEPSTCTPESYRPLSNRECFNPGT